MGTNKCASQAGMTAYGTRRHLYDPKMQTDKPFDQTTISLQMGNNKGASQVSDTLIILVSESTKGPFKFTLNLILINQVQSGYFCAIYIYRVYSLRKVRFAEKAKGSKDLFCSHTSTVWPRLLLAVRTAGVSTKPEKKDTFITVFLLRIQVNCSDFLLISNAS